MEKYYKSKKVQRDYPPCPLCNSKDTYYIKVYSKMELYIMIQRRCNDCHNDYMYPKMKHLKPNFLVNKFLYGK